MVRRIDRRQLLPVAPDYVSLNEVGNSSFVVQEEKREIGAAFGGTGSDRRYRALLRARRERPRCSCAAEQRDSPQSNVRGSQIQIGCRHGCPLYFTSRPKNASAAETFGPSRAEFLSYACGISATATKRPFNPA
jgi:hypothetical protein